MGEGELDIYQVAKLYHNKRPGVWRTEEDFLYLYRVFESLYREGGGEISLESMGTNGSSVPERRHSSSEWRGSSTAVKIPLARRHSHPSGAAENGTR